MKLFLEQGFSSTPPKQIFEEADVSAGTFYHLYKAKSDVLKEFIGFMFSNQFGIAGKIIFQRILVISSPSISTKGVVI